MWQLAQIADLYGAPNYTSPSSGSSSGAGVILLIIYLVIIVVFLAASWRIFEKAGQAGWKVIIPIYGTIIALRIVGLSGWYFLLFLVPFVNVVFAVIVLHRLSKSFGYGVGMTLLQLIAIGHLILGFGGSTYKGPNGEGDPSSQSNAPAPPVTPAAQPPNLQPSQ